MGLQNPADERAAEQPQLPQPLSDLLRVSPRGNSGSSRHFGEKAEDAVQEAHFYFSSNVLTRHPLGGEVPTLADKPCREQEPKVARERREMCQKHGVMAALKATPVCSSVPRPTLEVRVSLKEATVEKVTL